MTVTATKLQPVHKNSMLAKVRKVGVFIGYIAPSNVNYFHINGGWHIGMSVIITTDREGNFHYVSPNYDSQPLEDMIANFKHYNCNPELGNRVRFWES